MTPTTRGPWAPRGSPPFATSGSSRCELPDAARPAIRRGALRQGQGRAGRLGAAWCPGGQAPLLPVEVEEQRPHHQVAHHVVRSGVEGERRRMHQADEGEARGHGGEDRKSTRLNSSHVRISYAVFCLKKKK